jgi:hypothetical protein
LIVDPPVLHALPTALLYLLCFAYHRFHHINDNLISTFIHLIAQYEKQAKLAADGGGLEGNDRDERATAGIRSGAKSVH